MEMVELFTRNMHTILCSSIDFMTAGVDTNQAALYLLCDKAQLNGCIAQYQTALTQHLSENRQTS